MFHAFEELNVWLGQRCHGLWSELLHPKYNGLTVAKALELERVDIMPTAFDGNVERTVRVSHLHGQLARDRYSVTWVRVSQWVSSRFYPSMIVLIAETRRSPATSTSLIEISSVLTALLHPTHRAQAACSAQGLSVTVNISSKKRAHCQSFSFSISCTKPIQGS